MKPLRVGLLLTPNGRFLSLSPTSFVGALRLVRLGVAVASTILMCLPLLGQENEETLWRVPVRIDACVARAAPLAKSGLTLDSRRNPYYLRGDFDGDGRPDLAVALKSTTEKSQVGIVVCRDHFTPVLLGSIAKGRPFTDDPGDMVASPGWAVLTRPELLKLLKHTNPQRHATTGILRRISTVMGEMIYMPYETDEGLIYYWRGQFRWYTINSSDFPQDTLPKE